MPKGRTVDRLQRLDWITEQLQDAEQINSQDIMLRFEVSQRSALYDIEILRDAYKMKITWDARERTFKLDE